ncbi:hypothetical protein HC761_00080 [bacterium]|nr:hypothetical protein [bacterium]
MEQLPIYVRDSDTNVARIATLADLKAMGAHDLVAHEEQRLALEETKAKEAEAKAEAKANSDPAINTSAKE